VNANAPVPEAGSAAIQDDSKNVIFSDGPIEGDTGTDKSLGSKRWRPLTAGEIEMLRKVYRDAINYSKVRIYHHKFMPFQSNFTAMTPNGNIYFPKHMPAGFYQEDYSLELNDFSSVYRFLFVHEMGHVYQKEQGIPVVSRRLTEGGVYDYVMSPVKDLNDYTVEQQAGMIAKYADKCLVGSRPDQSDACREDFMPALKNFIKDPKYLRAAEIKRREAASGGDDVYF
jgi:hypothetical protein